MGRGRWPSAGTERAGALGLTPRGLTTTDTNSALPPTKFGVRPSLVPRPYPPTKECLFHGGGGGGGGGGVWANERSIAILLKAKWLPSTKHSGHGTKCQV